MLAQMDFEELINDFARKKSRRRAFWSPLVSHVCRGGLLYMTQPH
jgi:hypothetical protein